MKNYQLSTPRAAFGLSAVAMAAIALGTLVALPARLEFANADPYVVAATRAATEMPVGAAVSPARVAVPTAVDRGQQVRPGAAAKGTQELRAKREKSGSRGRTDT